MSRLAVLLVVTEVDRDESEILSPSQCRKYC